MDDALQASFWLMVVLQTLGSVDMPGSGDRKMPAPRAYLATIVIWSILQVAADAGFERPTKYMAWLIVLTSLVVGPFGAKLTGLLNKVASVYGSPAAGTVLDTPVGASVPGAVQPTPTGPAPVPTGFPTLSPTP